MQVQILDEAEQDLLEGAHFYEHQIAGLGQYFLDSLFSDIDSLQIYGGIHCGRIKGIRGSNGIISQWPLALTIRSTTLRTGFVT